MRLFVGIPVGDAVHAELRALVERLRAPGDGLRWAAPEGWHITLEFLGSATQEECRCVRERLSAIRREAFAIELEPPEFFERAGVFHAGVRLTQELEALERAVTQATAACGFEAEARAYRPHITLARSKGRVALAALKRRLGATPELGSFWASAFVLYESFPGPGGSRDEERGRFALGDAGSRQQRVGDRE